MSVEIKDRFTGAVVATGSTIKEAVESTRDLSDCDLSGSNLSGSKYNGIEVSKAECFTGLYMYLTMPVIDARGEKYIRLGCYFRTVEDWANDFWNNNSEFPNNGDFQSERRWFAYQTCLRCFEMMEAQESGTP